MSAFENVEFADNPEPRCPCILLLDTSGSMGGDPINELNAGLKAFQQALLEDSLAKLRVEVAIISFGEGVTLEQDFVTVENLQTPTLYASGSTPMGEGIQLALDKIDERKKTYKTNGISYYRPWVFLITDGEPTDQWQPAAGRVQQLEASKGVAFFSVGVGGANTFILQQISARQPIKLKGLNFKEMFVWLSSSLASVSNSRPGEEVPLQSPLGWGAV